MLYNLLMLVCCIAAVAGGAHVVGGREHAHGGAALTARGDEAGRTNDDEEERDLERSELFREADAILAETDNLIDYEQPAHLSFSAVVGKKGQ